LVTLPVKVGQTFGDVLELENSLILSGWYSEGSDFRISPKTGLTIGYSRDFVDPSSEYGITVDLKPVKGGYRVSRVKKSKLDSEGRPIKKRRKRRKKKGEKVTKRVGSKFTPPKVKTWEPRVTYSDYPEYSSVERVPERLPERKLLTGG